MKGSHLALKDLDYVAFDIETTGSYPLHSEICEVAGIKWSQGKIVDEFQSLVKPSIQMSDFIIGIHGITNEMVENAPSPKEVTKKFHKFIAGCAVVGHHSPFDVGFMSYEFEKLFLPLPEYPVFCSSLLSRKLFPESTNHKLQTLVEFFQLPKGQAHRALDDSKACWEITTRCFDKLGWDMKVSEALKFQGHSMGWPQFSILELENHPSYNAIILALKNKEPVELNYRSHSDKRRIYPIGIVRNPDGDYLIAKEEADIQHKRFYLNKIVGSQRLLI